jgi:hypothetical protein
LLEGTTRNYVVEDEGHDLDDTPAPMDPFGVFTPMPRTSLGRFLSKFERTRQFDEGPGAARAGGP